MWPSRVGRRGAESVGCLGGGLQSPTATVMTRCKRAKERLGLRIRLEQVR